MREFPLCLTVEEVMFCLEEQTPVQFVQLSIVFNAFSDSLILPEKDVD